MLESILQLDYPSNPPENFISFVKDPKALSRLSLLEAQTLKK